MYPKLFLLFILSIMLLCKTSTEKKYEVFNAAQTAFTYSGRTEMRNDTTQALISSAAHFVCLKRILMVNL
ncbi:hypothetical protein [Pricia sp.]|uniref:hypothetical protein n=1 Tax=Pricia sp. TaxID=2268138 RepID=UPI0035937D66